MLRNGTGKQANQEFCYQSSVRVIAYFRNFTEYNFFRSKILELNIKDLVSHITENSYN